MTTGNKHWAIGRAVERAFADKGATFHAYQQGNNDDWVVRDARAAQPRNFVRRFAMRDNGYGYVVVQEFGAMTSPYINSERGGMSERPYVGETYRKLECLWFEVREMNLGYNIVDTVDELFTLANMEAEIEEERNEMHDEKEALEEKIEKLEAQVIALEAQCNNLEEQLEQARSAP